MIFWKVFINFVLVTAFAALAIELEQIFYTSSGVVKPPTRWLDLLATAYLVFIQNQVILCK